MRRFIKDAKGAVTVFVTMLLIPAILVSGTAVDLSRIHAARSILQDANQLAANSVLTQYNALLYDLYGLMGVAKDDPILGDLLDEYIRVAVFGEEMQSRELGTLQIFYGSDLTVEEIDFACDKNLRDTDVLRRQIEEYMKFRGPVLIVKQFLDTFENNKIKEDTEVIDKKLDIDSGISELYDKYQELYDAIIYADKLDQVGPGITGSTVGTVSSRLKALSGEFGGLRACYATWETLIDRLSNEPGDTEESRAMAASLEDEITDCEARYNAILDNIRIQIVGGRPGTVWGSGRWVSFTSSQGLHTTVANAITYADEKGKPRFDAVLDLAREIDAMNDELGRKIDELERRLENGQCSEQLKNSLLERTGQPPMTMIERYRDILKWDNVTSMATVFKDGGYSYIDDILKPLLQSVKYRNRFNEAAGSLTREQMAAIQSDPRFTLSASVPVAGSATGYFGSLAQEIVTYEMPPGFVKFADHPGENRAFFEALSKMVNQPKLDPVKLYDGQKDESGATAKKKQENIIDSVLKLVESAYTGLTNSPLGGRQINDSGTAVLERMGILEIVKLIPQAMGNTVMNAFHDPLGSVGKVGDYLLLLTYSTSMFSNYTTTRPDSIGISKNNLSEIKFTKSITGVPISPEINFFFQSEWEYLYSGHQNAAKNLNAITRLLFLVRLVCNYITVFSVSEVTTIVTNIQTAFAWSPPLGLVLGELARAAFVAAESLIDVATLRTGHKVPLLKNVENNEWICSPKGVFNAIKNIMSDETTDEDKTKNEKGLSYDNYMHIFFLAKALFDPNAAAELAMRTGDLIEWNMINYKNGVNADDSKMAEAMKKADCFRLTDMKTDFDITTSVNMRMLFLSMPLAAKGTGGVIPPATFPLSVTDYRGY